MFHPAGFPRRLRRKERDHARLGGTDGSVRCGESPSIRHARDRTYEEQSPNTPNMWAGTDSSHRGVVRENVDSHQWRATPTTRGHTASRAGSRSLRRLRLAQSSLYATSHPRADLFGGRLDNLRQGYDNVCRSLAELRSRQGLAQAPLDPIPHHCVPDPPAGNNPDSWQANSTRSCYHYQSADLTPRPGFVCPGELCAAAQRSVRAPRQRGGCVPFHGDASVGPYRSACACGL